MKIIREFFSPGLTEHYIKEDKETGEKDIFIRGIFAQGNITNKNNRLYPMAILERELYKLQQKVAASTLTGDLDHPKDPEVLLKNAAFKITSLKKDGDNIIGEGKILRHTQFGAIAWGLAKDGVKFGTSTRGLGTLSEKESVQTVNDDYSWKTNDLVSDPSAPEAWVESIMENAEFYIDNGYIKEDVHASYKNRLKRLSKEDGETLKIKVVNLYQDFLKNL